MGYFMLIQLNYEERVDMTKKKKSLPLLISWILARELAALAPMQQLMRRMRQSADAAQALGAGIATAMVTPHMIFVFLAVIFNILGWAGNIRWSALCGAILYAVALALFLPYFMFVVVEMILSFVGFAKMKKSPAPVPEQNASGQ